MHVYSPGLMAAAHSSRVGSESRDNSKPRWPQHCGGRQLGPGGMGWDGAVSGLDALCKGRQIILAHERSSEHGKSYSQLSPVSVPGIQPKIIGNQGPSLLNYCLGKCIAFYPVLFPQRGTFPGCWAQHRTAGEKSCQWAQEMAPVQVTAPLPLPAAFSVSSNPPFGIFAAMLYYNTFHIFSQPICPLPESSNSSPTSEWCVHEDKYISDCQTLNPTKFLCCLCSSDLACAVDQ